MENTEFNINLPPEKIEFDPQVVERLLNQRNMSQAELARLGGYSHRNAINRIIKKKKVADATDLLRFCVIFDQPPQVFAKKV